MQPDFLRACICRKYFGGGYSLDENYTETDELTEDQKYDFFQKNGSAATGEDGAVFIKTAEWTNKSEGQAKISLQYQTPEYNDPSTAVFIFGECAIHGFSETIAQKQIEELLAKYDQVDCITFHHAGISPQTYEGTTEEYAGEIYPLQQTFYASDGTENEEKVYNFLHQFTQQFWGSMHFTGTMALQRLQEYLKDHSPYAIYISFDGSHAFQVESDMAKLNIVSLSTSSYFAH